MTQSAGQNTARPEPGHARWCVLGNHPPAVPCSDEPVQTRPGLGPEPAETVLRDVGLLLAAAMAPGAHLGHPRFRAAAERVAEALGVGDGDTADEIAGRLWPAIAPAAEPPDRPFTGRGFATYDQFADTYGTQVTVRESSAAEAACCWIFTEHPSGEDAGAHLDVARARRVRRALGAFITEHGEPL